MTVADEALAVAVARAAMRGDRRAVVRLLLSVEQYRDDAEWFRDDPDGGSNVRLDRFLANEDGLPTAGDLEELPLAEEWVDDDDLPIAEEIDDEIPVAESLTHNEEELVNGSVIHMASSNVEAIMFLYDPRRGSTGDLVVEFKGTHKKGNPVYIYFGVPLSVAVQMIETDSPGRFVWNKLRDRYRYQRIGSMPGNPRRNVVRAVPD